MAKKKQAASATATSDGTVVIKKYANRRLYDTSESRYVNLERIAELLRDGVDVKVVEAKTSVDVTRQVLTQIIVEGSKEAGGPPTEFLKDLIRSGDRAQKDFLHWYLSSAAQVYQRVREGWEKAYRMSPAGRLNEQLAKTWDPGSVVPAMMRGLLPFLDPSKGGQRKASGVKSEERSSGDDTAAQLAKLRAQLEALEERIEG